MSSGQPANFKSDEMHRMDEETALKIAQVPLTFTKKCRNVTTVHGPRGNAKSYVHSICLQLCTQEYIEVLHMRQHMSLWKSKRNHSTHVTVIPSCTSRLNSRIVNCLFTHVYIITIQETKHTPKQKLPKYMTSSPYAPICCTKQGVSSSHS